MPVPATAPASSTLTLQEAAWRAVTIPVDYAQQGRSLAWAALAGRRVFESGVHHPRRDVVDRAHGTRFFYHAHAVSGESAVEHGHFHLFEEHAQGFSHLAALSLDAQGRPLRWFCTNRWVTGEHWQPATRWAARVTRFGLRSRGRMAPVARWLEAMVHLYREELLGLLRERDALLKHVAHNAREREAFFENRQRHILSSHSIALDRKLRSLL